MTRTILLAAVALVPLGWAVGCGPSRQTREVDFTVQTKPSGARVYVDGEPRGDTPQKIRLKFRFVPEAPFDGIERHFIHVEKAGFEPDGRDVRSSDPSTVFFLLKTP